MLAARWRPESSSSSQTGGDTCLGGGAGLLGLCGRALVLVLALAPWECAGSACWPLSRHASRKASSLATPGRTEGDRREAGAEGGARESAGTALALEREEGITSSRRGLSITF